MRATIKDIAEYCKISVGTVDRALNNRSGISEKTKKKILEAAEILNYHPNHTGRSLAKGRTMTIGVVCFDLCNNFFPELIDTIEARAKEKGFFIYLILTHRDFSLEEDGISYLCERQVDGIILFPVGLSQTYINSLKNLGIPIVTIYNRLDESFPFVGVNDRCAMEDAVEHLLNKGYRRISYLTPDIAYQRKQGLNTYTLQQRLTGYQKGMQRFNLKAEVLEAGSLEEKLDYFLERQKFDEKTALLCLCDSYAVKAIEYLRKRNVCIPEQVGIMGYDNIQALEYIHPRLATIGYSVRQMGQAVIDILFECMDNPEYFREYLLDYTIIDGDSLI